jgi:transcriptional regulator with XRE-family HTH domain
MERAMITQLGKELKKLRIDLGITLMDMSKKIGVSSAFLSAIETGRKRVPENFLEGLAAAYPEVNQHKDQYEVLINQARKEVRLMFNGNNIEDAKLATALARRFNNLDANEREKLMKFLEAGA